MSEIFNTTTPQSAENTHFLPTHFQEVSEVMDKLGYPNNLNGILQPPTHTKIPEGTAVTPNLSKGVDKILQNSRLPFELNEDIDGCFGNAEGSANCTTTFEKTGMAMEEAFELLDMTGQFDDAKKIIDMKKTDSDPEVNTILTYFMATLSKGWRAEKFLDGLERFTTGSESQDQGGMDLYDKKNDEWIQLKPMTTLASNGTSKFKNKKYTHLFYMWTGNGDLKVSTLDKWKEAKNAEAENVSFSSTLLVKSPKNLKVNKETRSFRYLWW